MALFDSWLVLRGIKTMALRVERQQQNAIRIAQWLQLSPAITKVIYVGLPEHPDNDIHTSQASGGGAVICFLTGNILLSEHIVTATELFKITVSFGNMSSVIFMPGRISSSSSSSQLQQQDNVSVGTGNQGGKVAVLGGVGGARSGFVGFGMSPRDAADESSQVMEEEKSICSVLIETVDTL